MVALEFVEIASLGGTALYLAAIAVLTIDGGDPTVTEERCLPCLADPRGQVSEPIHLTDWESDDPSHTENKVILDIKIIRASLVTKGLTIFGTNTNPFVVIKYLRKRQVTSQSPAPTPAHAGTTPVTPHTIPDESQEPEYIEDPRDTFYTRTVTEDPQTPEFNQSFSFVLRRNDLDIEFKVYDRVGDHLSYLCGVRCDIREWIANRRYETPIPLHDSLGRGLKDNLQIVAKVRFSHRSDQHPQSVTRTHHRHMEPSTTVNSLPNSKVNPNAGAGTTTSTSAPNTTTGASAHANGLHTNGAMFDEFEHSNLKPAVLSHRPQTPVSVGRALVSGFGRVKHSNTQSSENLLALFGGEGRSHTKSDLRSSSKNDLTHVLSTEDMNSEDRRRADSNIDSQQGSLTSQKYGSTLRQYNSMTSTRTSHATSISSTDAPTPLFTYEDRERIFDKLINKDDRNILLGISKYVSEVRAENRRDQTT